MVSGQVICAGQGANQFTYYVTNDLAGAWRKLPDIKPKEAHVLHDGIEHVVRINVSTS